MKAFCWTEVLCHYQCGYIIVIDEDLAVARKQIENRIEEMKKERDYRVGDFEACLKRDPDEVIDLPTIIVCEGSD